MKTGNETPTVLLVLDYFDDLNKADSSGYRNKSSQGFKLPWKIFGCSDPTALTSFVDPLSRQLQADEQQQEGSFPL